MLIIMNSQASEREIEEVAARVRALGRAAHVARRDDETVIGAVGEGRRLPAEALLRLPGVANVVPLPKPYKLASRDFQHDDSVVMVRGVPVGGRHTAVIAGPCTVEGEAMLWRIARHCRERGAAILRGGAFKPRSSPYSFQGLGAEALAMLRACGDELGMPVCTEVMETRQVEAVARHADLIQVGARNMQNYSLLSEVGKTHKPVLLKRGLSASVKEWLLSAEYVLAEGNPNVILCERGIKTFEESVRYSLDVTSVPVVRRDSHLPILVDPSHAAGRRELVGALALAGIAAGAHGLVVEVHDQPETALCDGPQALLPGDLEGLMGKVQKISEALGRKLFRPAREHCPLNAAGNDRHPQRESR